MNMNQLSSSSLVYYFSCFLGCSFVILKVKGMLGINEILKKKNSRETIISAVYFYSQDSNLKVLTV